MRRYQDRLYPTLVRLTGSPENAQDVLQDAFIRAFEKLDQFHGESSFYTWIYRISINLALSARRRRRRGKDRVEAIPLSPVVDPVDDSPGTDPGFALEHREREALVEAALKALAPDHRAVVVLKDFDGRRYEEIADLLDIPVGTVRSRLHRARCELRERLRPLVEEQAAAAPGLADVGGPARAGASPSPSARRDGG
ncbi:sigma-70 family RNA polymerase sigma factor [Aquisphaera insulae]|uniref:sigma-70 family RNA polymerase sigma factor n=1 Tax=Aquisphaera insulae TaxID=2712864 RepID=UPI00202E5478